MGIDYTVEPILGFWVSRNELKKKFLRSVEASEKKEPRWDPKTGLPVEPETVTGDDGDEWWELDGKRLDFGDEMEFVELLCKKLKCASAEDGSHMCDDYDYVFGPKLKLKEKEGLDYHWTVYEADLSLEKMAVLKDQLEELEHQLDQLGIKHGPEKLHVCVLVC